MRLLIICLSLLLLGSCKSKIIQKQKGFNKVEIVHLVEDSTLNVRALEIVDSIGPIYLTSKGELGILLQNAIINTVDSLKDKPFYNHKINLSNDTLLLNFRALAANKSQGFGITIGNPALLYKLDADLEKNKIVYQENHPNVFYDSMDFWNDQEGIAIGDPTDGCMSVIITRDGGENWIKMSCDNLPSTKEGEAAFAASDTNIAIVGDETWVATGGKTSRVMYSPDKGITWRVFDTPIVQGKETTGIYSIDFYDENNGFAIGGDYTNPKANSANKIRTTTGGVTWQVVSDSEGPGYRSCVQYIPNSGGKELVAVGFNGIDYSADSGTTWKHLSNEGFYTIRFLNDSTAYAAGKGRVSKLIFTE
ncbi:WD40/YVTN/BNR-like repeat-containing protein [Winogradskyella wichelsiae]|uniref:WD40/YVTN/BNR-like repeat-containing protein n=1 Tax=Winogradskyella wichelsiae TaxID=2697007 RepID=UPI003EF45623